MMNRQEHIEAWTKENEPSGKMFGYPQCCIDQFCSEPPALLKYRKPIKDDINRIKSSYINGRFTGFIPCSRHAEEILSGKLQLKDLIKNRKYPLPFPFH